jgi:hypothetical protein
MYKDKSDKKYEIQIIISAFHDCVGGCNGCINFNNPDNNGLQNATIAIDNLYYSNGYETVVNFLSFSFHFNHTVKLGYNEQILK